MSKLDDLKGELMEVHERFNKIIIGVAIKLDNNIYSLPKPNRHHDVIKMMNKQGVAPHLGTQGFVLENGTFLTREESAVLALASGQIKTLNFSDQQLFSEDLW